MEVTMITIMTKKFLLSIIL